LFSVRLQFGFVQAGIASQSRFGHRKVVTGRSRRHRET